MSGRRPEISRFFLLAGVIALLVVPFVEDVFIVRMVTRMMIFGLAALSLDLVLGYGGMVSFGHAAFFGIGGYTVGILSFYGVNDGFLTWPLAIGAGAVLALAIGAISLRTRGVYFIMITLAFAQLLFFLFTSFRQFGRDEGMTMSPRQDFSGVINIGDHITYYYLVFALLALIAYLLFRLVNSRFGIALQGIRDNEQRMQMIGFPTYRYKLAAFVISGAICALAGVLVVNNTLYVTPGLFDWTVSGIFLVMVIFGGVGTLIGPIIGAFVYLSLEEFLSDITQHWMIILGPLLLIVVLFARGGLAKLLSAFDRRR